MAALVQCLTLVQEALQAPAPGSTARAQEEALDKLRVLVWLSQRQLGCNRISRGGQKPHLVRLALLPLLTSLHAGGATAEERGPGPSPAAAGMGGATCEGAPLVPLPAAAPAHAGLPGSNGQAVTDPMSLTQEEPGGSGIASCV
ncbi:hypothetical protein HaLaN_15529 [Haematococcus lacustris]|uniref:Uncharacterized protein n=1 Tax=Haematococcus lacustris TaxID=44745 RepID=A0A699ZIN9_HAELA|nr:hypothetical protein HaLaN_15529 [Haematococcus lacustris]